MAEVLITPAIIGVVAAVTIPALIQNYQEKVRITQLKKEYSVFEQPFLMVVNEYGTPDKWGLNVTVNEVPSVRGCTAWALWMILM